MGKETYYVAYNHLPELAAALHEEVAKIVKETAEQIISVAGVNAPEVTGFMKSSIYMVTHDASTYGQAITPGKPGSHLLPEVDKPPDDLTAFVAVAANYGVFVNFGTSRMPANPFFNTAAVQAQQRFTLRMETLEKRLAQAVPAP